MDSAFNTRPLLRPTGDPPSSDVNLDNSFLPAVLDTVENLIVVLDHAGNIVAFNHACELLTGYCFADVRGRPLWDLLLPLEERDTVRGYFDKLLHVSEPSTFRNHWCTTNGGRLMISWSNFLLRDAAGQVRYVVGTGIDITAQLAAEEAVRRSEKSYQAVVEQASDGILIADHYGQLLETNAQAATMLGYEVDQLVGRFVAYLLAPEDSDRFVALRSRISAGGTVRDEMQLSCADGRLLPVELSSRMLDDGRVLSIVRDVSDRKKAEEALRRSQELFYKAFHAGPEAKSITRSDGLIVDVNEPMLRLLGYSRDEIIGHTSQELHLWADRDHYAQLVRTLSERGAVSAVEATGRNKQGELFDAIVALVLVNVNDEPCVITSVVDITMRKQAELALAERERQYRTLLEQASDAIFLTDSNNNYIEVNESACLLTGYSRAELLSMTPNDIIVQDAACLAASFQAAAHMRAEVSIRRKDGAVVPVESVGGVLDDGRVMAIVRDVGERKRAENERLARLAAEQANQAKSEFLGRMSHELRTPLNSILGFAQLLAMDNLPPQQQESINYILRSGRHLLELINEALDISRIEQGRMVLKVEAVPVAPLLTEMQRMIRPLAADDGIEIQLYAEKVTALAVHADRQRLAQVLINLLSNAVKYNRPGGIISLSCTPTGDNHLRFSVSDTGPGIPSEDLTRIFQPFERLAASQRAVEGSGLGLSLSQLLIEAMGSHLEVRSTIGQGSSFWFDLPIIPS